MEQLRQLSGRTSLRTKLITSVLGLVIVALAAISFTSVNLLNSYLTTQHDDLLTSVYQNIVQNADAEFAGQFRIDRTRQCQQY